MLIREREVAVELARRAGEILRESWGRPGLVVERKGVINPVTEIDRRSEALISDGLRQAFPGCGILAEEGTRFASDGRGRWIIDPLDGTVNYLKGYPLVAVSIGFELDGQLVLGVVYNPITDELFTGESGQGAALNNNPIQVGQAAGLAQAMVASGFPYDAWTNPDNNTREWAALLRQSETLRCDGSAALDLCMVACGRLDAYWEKGVRAWDVAAGAVIVREAGGLVSDYLGGDDLFERREVVAANPGLAAALREALVQVRQHMEGD